ncbi:MAG TPA: PQQ-binding-like beta-propeller repeat protein, partial [Gemmatimonadales bacterium]|nr:PQQ-binding-like beta-propeller repeat protein [Gemmatimonadales bacterium]
AAPAWTVQADQPIEWLRFLPSRILVVSSDDGLRGLNPADGSAVWRRADLGNVSQTTFEGAQQSAPLAGGPAKTGTAAPVIRTMEELPGGRLAAILADSGGVRSWFDVIDLTTGTTAWSSSALGIGDAHGFLPFPDSGTILVYGTLIEPGRRRQFWTRVTVATGEKLWTTDSLLLSPPVQFDAAGLVASRGTINGNQPLVPLTDSTVLLAASGDGLVCFEIGSGRVRWRAPVAGGQVGPVGQGYAPLLFSGDTAYVATAHQVDAIEISTHRMLWSAGSFPTITTQTVMTSGGLLVRGQPLAVAGEDPRRSRPFAALLDLRNGRSRWKEEFDRGAGITPFLLSGDTAWIASDKGLLRLSLAGGTATAVTTGKLPGRPATTLERQGGDILLAGAQSLTLLGPDGTQRYQIEFPAPTLSLGGRILRVALGAAAIAAGAYYSAGSLAGSAFARYQYSTSAYLSQYAYFVLKDHEGQGPALAKVDKRTGEVAAVVPLNGEKSPEYAIDAYSGLLLLKQDRQLQAFRW